MGKAAVDLPDPLQATEVGKPLTSTDDLLAQLAGDEIDRLLAEVDDTPPSAPAVQPAAPRPAHEPARPQPTSPRTPPCRPPPRLPASLPLTRSLTTPKPPPYWSATPPT